MAGGDDSNTGKTIPGDVNVRLNSQFEIKRQEERAEKAFSLLLTLADKMRQDEAEKRVGINENKRRKYKLAFLTRDIVYAIRNGEASSESGGEIVPFVDVINLSQGVLKVFQKCYSALDHGLLHFTYKLFPENNQEIADNSLKTNGDLFPEDGEKEYREQELATPFAGKVLALYFGISDGRISQFKNDYERFIEELFGKAVVSV